MPALIASSPIVSSSVMHRHLCPPSCPTASAGMGAAARSAAPFLGLAADVPRLGLGLAALGRPGYINLGHGGDLRAKTQEAMQEQCAQVLDEAHALGIR